MRDDLRQFPTMEAGQDMAVVATVVPVVLADFAGCEAPSDAPLVLRSILALGLRDVAFARFWDAVWVGMCQPPWARIADQVAAAYGLNHKLHRQGGQQHPQIRGITPFPLRLNARANGPLLPNMRRALIEG